MKRVDIFELTNFLADYADSLIGMGAHNSRVIRCIKRIALSYGYEASIFVLLKFINISLNDISNPHNKTTLIKDAKNLNINLEVVSELSALSWAIKDEKLSLEEAIKIYNAIIKPKKQNQLFANILISFSFGAFCGLFHGDFWAICFVIIGTFMGILLKNFLTKHNVDLRIIYIISAFISSFIAFLSYEFNLSSTPSASISASILYLFPGIILLNSMFDILDGNVLIGLSRIVNTAILVLCMSIGIYITLTIVNFGFIQ
ncbi:threonine/serine exporter family protein [Campylobacter sp. FMV-PI01]|uniref:Threonine/serine exporter family protein n=1 Tax=Campylobacter portucalensis TaxID=2608384 RepID=A0A6L5WIL3_9BACT|nr:threonine/serine exporter family protein [Campylobacter portucalensis]MSN96087.1 threonine/serine exporter family protein [Campylobacter portucalensis]